MDAPSNAPDEAAGSPAGSARGARESRGLLALFLLVASLAQLHFVGSRYDCFDFYQFWWVGQHASEAQTGDVWSPGERERLAQLGAREAMRLQGPGEARPRTKRAIAAVRRPVLETYSTPWLYTLFGLFASGDYERDLGRFQLASLLSLALGLALLARLSGQSWLAAGLLVAAATAWFSPALSDARVGNVNRLQVGVLAVYLLLASRTWRGRDVAAGAVLGMAAMFKPNLAYPVLTLGLGWIAMGHWRKLVQQALGTLAGVLVAFGVSSAWFGSASSWRDWSAVLSELMNDFPHPIDKGNFSLPRILADTLGVGSSGLLLALLLALFAGALFLRRRAGAAGGTAAGHEDMLLVGLGGALSLLTAKLAWLHYFLLILPLVVVCLRPSAPRGVRALAALAFLALALEPLRDLSGLEESTLTSAATVCGGALLLFLVGLYDLASPRPSSAA